MGAEPLALFLEMSPDMAKNGHHLLRRKWKEGHKP